MNPHEKLGQAIAEFIEDVVESQIAELQPTITKEIIEEIDIGLAVEGYFEEYDMGPAIGEELEKYDFTETFEEWIRNESTFQEYIAEHHRKLKEELDQMRLQLSWSLVHIGVLQSVLEEERTLSRWRRLKRWLWGVPQPRPVQQEDPEIIRLTPVPTKD